jgi:phage virion morphogenesis protein
MAGVGVTPDFSEISAAAAKVGAMAEAGADARPLMADIGASLLVSTQSRFERQRDPEGHAWPELAPATLFARGKKGKTKKKRKAVIANAKILRDTARLFRSLTYQASNTATEVGSNVIYARIHQDGGKAGRGRNVDIPQREYLGLSDDDKAMMERKTDAWLGGVAI